MKKLTSKANDNLIGSNIKKDRITNVALQNFNNETTDKELFERKENTKDINANSLDNNNTLDTPEFDPNRHGQDIDDLDNPSPASNSMSPNITQVENSLNPAGNTTKPNNLSLSINIGKNTTKGRR